jgi:hypothetical protein
MADFCTIDFACNARGAGARAICAPLVGGHFVRQRISFKTARDKMSRDRQPTECRRSEPCKNPPPQRSPDIYFLDR